MTRTLDAGDLARALGERIADLAALLLPGGRRDGWRYRCGSLAGGSGQSLIVTLQGPHRGRWWEFNGGFGGDALDLVAQTRCDGDVGQALAWARLWLGLGRLDPEQLEQQVERARQQQATRARDDAARRRHRSQDAKHLWLAASELRPLDPVWRYLLGRGIDLARLPRPPGALRHQRHLRHPTGQWFPAMVAAISGQDGSHLATQRTFLALDDDDWTIRKAPVRPAKMTLGSYRHAGGAVHLTRGSSGKSWKEAVDSEPVAISEGIEDGLAFAVLRPDLRVAACCTSLSYLAQIALPPGCASVIAIAQNDPPHSDAGRALAAGLAALRGRDIKVSVFRPPVWMKDTAALVQQGMAHG